MQIFYGMMVGIVQISYIVIAGFAGCAVAESDAIYECSFSIAVAESAKFGLIFDRGCR